MMQGILTQFSDRAGTWDCAAENMTKVAPAAPTKNVAETRDLYRAGVSWRTLRQDGHALTRAVPGGTEGKVPPNRQLARVSNKAGLPLHSVTDHSDVLKTSPYV